MSKHHRLPIALAPLVLAACHNDDSTARPEVQVVHASLDAPAVNVIVDGAPAVQNLDNGSGTAYTPLSANSHSIEVQAQTPRTPTTVISFIEGLAVCRAIIYFVSGGTEATGGS